MSTSKTDPGRFFEDFRIGETISHATPAIANLGYADGRFGAAVYPGDTLSAASRVIGLKENSNHETGVVYVRTTGINQRGETVLDYVRWFMLRKRDCSSPAPDPVVPALPEGVPADALKLPAGMDLSGYDAALAGSPHCWDDYAVGEKIDHVDGMTVEEACHMTATRLYQNTAKVHFNQHAQKAARFGRRIVYGGHVISLARALSFNGLASALRIAAINGGRHLNPCFAGDTLYAWSQVAQKWELPGRRDAGALRIRTFATKDRPCADFPAEGNDLLLDLDYTAILPRR